MDLYVISGVTGMTGNELVKQLLEDGKKSNHILGFLHLQSKRLKICLAMNDLAFMSMTLTVKNR